MKNKIVVILSLVFLLSFNVSSGTIIIPGNRIGNTMAGNHPPIRIIGNDQFTPENGVTEGSGTPNDPYIIENWVIISDGHASQGIFINGTDAYFVIRNCTITGFHDPNEHRQGIQLSVVTHGGIEETTIVECQTGIDIRYSMENKILNCSCSDYAYQNAYGIYIYYSINITVISSLCNNMDCGVFLVESSDITIQKTECSDNVNFGLLADVPHQGILHFLIEDCSFQDNGFRGIWLSGSRNTTSSIIRNCSFHGSLRGIHIDFVSSNIIENCVFGYNIRGLQLEKSDKNTIKNCSFHSNSEAALIIQGGLIIPCWKNNVSYCDFTDNLIGVLLLDTWRNKIHHCTIANNSYIGVISTSSSSDQITLNNIVNNGRNNTSALDLAGAYSCRSFLDLRHNWWGSAKGPSVSLLIGVNYWWKVLPIRIVNNSDVVMLRYGAAIHFPWLSAPVPDAGRQMG
jgi:parallel beta-helix repeat protein